MMQPLSSVCEIIMGQAPAGDTYNDEGVGLPLIAGASDFGDAMPEPSRFTSAAAKVSRVNDIIVCVRATIGDLNWSDKEYCLGRGVAALRVNERKADRKYIWRAVEHGAARLSSLGRGATFKQISKPDIENFEIPLPSLDEQKRIAAILDQADELRRKRQRAIDRLNQLGQAIFHEMFGDPSNLPRTHAFGDVAKIQQSLVDPKLASNARKLHVGPEHIGSNSGVVDWHRVRTAEEDNVISGKNEFSSGNILYSKIRPYLNKVALADRPGICSADMYVIDAIEGEARNQFLLSLLMGRDFLAYAETCSNRANIPKLNRQQVDGYRFFCPPIKQQDDFARRYDALVIKKESQTRGGKLNEALFEALQHRAFRGEL
jgi:type I restriction enzyme, S subunit